MTDSRHRELKAMLESGRNELIDQVRAKRRAITEAGTIGESRSVGDVSDQASRDAEEDIEVGLINLKSRQITQYGEALARLDQGTYGNCGDCGEEISPRRLKALPFATKCRDCKESEEAGDRIAATRAARQRRVPV